MRLSYVEFTIGTLDPSRAEVSVWVGIDDPPIDYQVRGRLVGPTCAYAGTVEIAYPLRVKERGVIGDCEGGNFAELHGVVPEPNLWDLQSPFQYRCIVELWQGDERFDQCQIAVGMRKFAVGKKRLSLNGQPIAFRGLRLTSCDEPTARRWRMQGVNLIMAPMAEASEQIWEIGSRIGICVLGRFDLDDDPRLVRKKMDFPATVGWVIPAELLKDFLFTVPLAALAKRKDLLIGVELEATIAASRLEVAKFVLCKEQAVRALADVDLPKVVLVDEMPDAQVQTAALEKGIVGWIQR